MKKIFKILSIFLIIITVFSCSSASSEFVENFIGEKVFDFTEKEVFLNKMKKYRLEAKIVTTKGDINMYLYPEAAPKLVANFVFLVSNDYYDDLNFYRVSVNNIIQSGDRVGDGTGYPGYYLDDEFSYLKFDRSGMVAMANAGKNTNGSQFFISLQKEESYNNNYSIIGSLKTANDLSIARLIRQEDKIIDIQISGNNVKEFLSNFENDVNTWKKELKK